MAHTLSTWWRLLMAGIRSEMQYKLDFFAQVLGNMLFYAAGMANIAIILHRFESIDGWRLGELALLYSLVFLTSGLANFLFMPFIDLSQILIRGELDRFLLRPANPFVLYMASKVWIFNWGTAFLGLIVLLWAVTVAPIDWTAAKLFYLLLVVAGGTLIQGSFVVLVGTLSFWFYETGVLYYTILMPARDLISYPVSLFPRALRFLLTFVLPFAFVNFVPAHALLDRQSFFPPLLAWATPLVGLLCFGAVYSVWLWGLTKYQGAGS
jgi:ABC-2 type transport system permease protein